MSRLFNMAYPGTVSLSRRGLVCWVGLSVVVGTSSVAYADGGTALTTTKHLHLVAGNALIGIVEGLLIGVLFRVRFRRSIPVMILANYASTLVAEFLLSVHGGAIAATLLGSEALYALPRVFRLLLVLTFIESLLVEWPFCLWVMKPGKHRVAKSVLAGLITQAVSYAALIPLYRLASDWSLYTEMTADRSVVSESTEPAIVYFVSLGDDAVCCINLNGTGLTKVSELDVARGQCRLFFRRSDDSWRWNLCAEHWDGQDAEKESVILKDLPVRAAGWRFRGEGKEQDGPPWGWPSVWDLRSEPDPTWTIEAAKARLVARNNRTGQGLQIGLETPLVRWYANSPTILPGDKVVCQFGDQVTLLDLRTRRVGLLASGRNPVACLRASAPTTRPRQDGK